MRIPVLREALRGHELLVRAMMRQAGLRVPPLGGAHAAAGGDEEVPMGTTVR